MHFESLKVVSEHLVERIKLEETACRDVPTLLLSNPRELQQFGNMNNNFMCSTMFLMNDSLQPNSIHQSTSTNSKKHDVELFNIAYDKGCNFDAANSLLRAGMITADKNFLAHRGQLHLTAQECGELFLKKITESNSILGNESHNLSTSHPNNPCNINDHSESRLPVTSNNSNNTNASGSNSSKSWPKSRQTFRVDKERPFSCPECGKSFLLKHHLVTHARVHSGERPHICTECGKSFAHKHCLSTHLLLHSSQRPYQCTDCKKSFTLKHHLVTHSRVHSRDRPFICQECGRTFPQKRHLVTHAKFHSGERPFVCEECGESFSQKEHLVMHSRFHGGQHSYACTDCGASFARKFELVNHERLHGRQPHSCNVCGKEFLQKRTLLAHVRLHVDEFPCQQCGEVFPNKPVLTEHFAVHIQEKAFLCRNFSAISPHFLCPQQAKASTTSAAVQTDSLHKPKPHVCTDCGKSFTQKHGLTQHNKRHLTGEGCDVRNHICSKCGKAFFQKNHLALHSRQHMEVVIKKEDCEASPVLNHNNSSTATSSQPTQPSLAIYLDATPVLSILPPHPSTTISTVSSNQSRVTTLAQTRTSFTSSNSIITVSPSAPISLELSDPSSVDQLSSTDRNWQISGSPKVHQS